MSVNNLILIIMCVASAITSTFAIATARRNRLLSVGFAMWTAAIVSIALCVMNFLPDPQDRIGLISTTQTLAGIFYLFTGGVLLYQFDTLWCRFKDMRNIIEMYEGGAQKRLSESQELLELLQTDAPQVLTDKPWVYGWFKSQDNYLRAMGDLGLEKDNAELKAVLSQARRGV